MQKDKIEFKTITLLKEKYDLVDIIFEEQNKEYEGMLFKSQNMEEYNRSRLAKKTPTKEGYFVTFWEKENGINKPYEYQETIKETYIWVIDGKKRGCFVFSNDILVKYGILSKNGSKGKMAMRVYPHWCDNLNEQAKKTQKWQLEYFKTF